MPTQGGSIAAGLERAATLLRQTGLSRGDVLVITDSEVADADLDLAGDLAGDGFRVSVLAVGTEQGGPIPRAEGGFVTDGNGQVVVPQLDAASLQRLAAVGGGRYAPLAPNDRDLDTLFPSPAALPLDVALDGSGDEQYEADVWLDRGLVLVLVLLPLLALAFRRGWIAVWLLVVLAPMPRAHAFEWRDLWQRPDQRGYEALEAQQADRAAELFENPEWRSAAQYRAEQFEASAASLANIESAAGHYNRGNALAKAGQLPAAIAAYDRALELDPSHEDARYNRDLVQQFLEDNPGAAARTPRPRRARPAGQLGPVAKPERRAARRRRVRRRAAKRAGRARRERRQPSRRRCAGPVRGTERRRAAGRGERRARSERRRRSGREATADAGGPEDVEQWASEQAAEQWLRRVPQDPGGLLRRKFLYQYQRLGVDQDGNRVIEGAAAEQRPW